MPEAEWNDERTKIICELFVEQVQAGNRPNTHLNNIGYRTVASKFQQRTQLLYTKMQLKNKWDKFKSDYICWKKLLVAGSGAGLHWDSARGTFAADEDWWKKINKELPGARRHQNAGMQNEDKMKIMFDYIDSNGVDPSLSAQNCPRNGVNLSLSAQNDVWNGVDPVSAQNDTRDGVDLSLSAQSDHKNGVDHSPLAADGLPSPPDSPKNGLPQPIYGAPSTSNSPPNGLPSTPDSPVHGMDDSAQTTNDVPPAPDSTMNGMNLHRPDNSTEHNSLTPLVHESVFPSNRNKKRPAHLNVTKKNKKTKTEMAMLMQSHLDCILELAQKAQATFEKFTTRVDPPSASIEDVMMLVRECGARCGSNEHFIATELFVNEDQRKMFLTMETPSERFQWLRRKYVSRYMSNPAMGEYMSRYTSNPRMGHR